MPQKPTYEELEKKVHTLELRATDQDNIANFSKENEQMYKNCFDNANVGVCLVDPDGNFIKVNNRMVEIFGYSKKEFEGMNVDDVSHPEDIVISKEVQRRVKNGEIASTVFQKRYIHNKGHMFWGRVSNSIVKDHDGKLLYYVTHFIDITESENILEELRTYENELEVIVHERTQELSQLNEALRKSESKLKNLLQAIQAGVVVHNVKKERIVQFNPAAQKLLGLSENQIFGRSTTEPGWGFVHEDGRSMQVDEYPVNIVKKTKQPLLDYIVGIYKPAKYFITWLMVNATPQFEKEGKLSEIIVSSMDITELKRVQFQLREKTLQLLQAQKMEAVGTLAGGIAHDFNNILSSVLGFTEISLGEVEQGSILEDNLMEVLRAGKRAKDLVAQILTFARQSEEKLGPVQVDIIAKEVLKFIRSSIPTSIEITSSINSDSVIMGNQTQIHQILMNLCTNAAYAMEGKGGILDVGLNDVTITRDSGHQEVELPFGNYLALSVSDTGTGIPPDVIDSIFDPYFTTKKQAEGTGLGLSMVQGIVENYGGRITVESRLGRGTTFVVYIPVIKKRRIRVKRKIEQLQGGTERILVVDDEAPIVKMCARNLESLGYSVNTQTSSLEALELFQTKPHDFDLVITDMTMPNMTGDVLAAELMAIRPEIPVLLFTGYSRKISEESVAELGIKALVYKPIVKADLAKTVRRVLDEARE